MKRLDKHQKRTVQFWAAFLRGIGALLLTLLLGVVIGCHIAASYETAAPPAVPVRNEPAPASEVFKTDVAAEPVYIGEFTATAYCPCEACCGMWSDGVTATGTVATEGRTAAVDPEVIPYGTELLVYFEDGSMGRYVAEDCGGTIKGSKIDVYYDSHEAALEAGVQTVSVYVIGEIEE